jgi:AcrR family transcriptional regulator
VAKGRNKIDPPPVRQGLPILGQAPHAVERSDAARNRKAILDAARRLLQKRPIEEICMDELADAAGVGKGTLYRRFADRASLCHALLDDEAKKLQARILAGAHLGQGKTWIDRLGAFLDAIFEFTAENASLLSEALRFERAANRYDHPAHDWQRQEVVLCLERAVRAKEIPSLRAHPTADMILAALDPDLILWHLERGTSRAQLKAAFHRLWRTGIQP